MSRIQPPRIEGALQLGDGRRLGFAEFGPPDGRPVLWFHGTPGARRQVPPTARAAADELGVRVIGIERPGVGASTPHLYPSVLGFAHDVREITERMNLGAIGLVGLSGGGAYVLACAHLMPEQVVAGAVLNGVAPTRGPDAPGGGLVAMASRFTPLLRAGRGPAARALWLGTRAAALAADPVLRAYALVSPDGDRRLLEIPEFKEMFVDDLVRGSRRRFSAPILDLLLFGRHWGFSVGEIEVPIHFWHGDADHLVPLAHGEHLAGLVPGATLSVRPGDNHLGSLAAGREVLETVVAEWPAPAARLRSSARAVP